MVRQGGNMMVLGLVSSGEKCEIVKISNSGGCGDECRDHGQGKPGADSTATRAVDLGLRVGKRIEMLRNEGNLLLVMVDNARIALDRRMAMKIMVREVGR